MDELLVLATSNVSCLAPNVTVKVTVTVHADADAAEVEEIIDKPLDEALHEDHEGEP